MATRNTIEINTTPKNVVASETDGSELVGYNTGSETIYISDAASAPNPITRTTGAFAYLPGEYLVLTVVSGEGSWAWTARGVSHLVLADK